MEFHQCWSCKTHSILFILFIILLYTQQSFMMQYVYGIWPIINIFQIAITFAGKIIVENTEDTVPPYSPLKVNIC